MKNKGGDQTDSVSKTESVFEAGLPTMTYRSRGCAIKAINWLKSLHPQGCFLGLFRAEAPRMQSIQM